MLDSLTLMMWFVGVAVALWLGVLLVSWAARLSGRTPADGGMGGTQLVGRQGSVVKAIGRGAIGAVQVAGATSLLGVPARAYDWTAIAAGEPVVVVDISSGVLLVATCWQSIPNPA